MNIVQTLKSQLPGEEVGKIRLLLGVLWQKFFLPSRGWFLVLDLPFALLLTRSDVISELTTLLCSNFEEKKCLCLKYAEISEPVFFLVSLRNSLSFRPRPLPIQGEAKFSLRCRLWDMLGVTNSEERNIGFGGNVIK